MSIMIPVQEEYGAELYLWASPFTHFTEIILWWIEKDNINIYQNTIQEILTFGKIEKLHSEHEIDTFYECINTNKISINLDDNTSSYLIHNHEIYFHKGFTGRKWTI
ncbi:MULTISPECIES: hypothetical protein [Acinetobacter]|uniref:hypothetical protein n=1 Tax=Acinetobacter TaxID=469 RepID=UPI00062912DF|nr:MULTISPECIES: hypothetical protein [Acinetobacter]KKW75148.1 hypothetical protein AAV96_17430 [Acinetobacter sp. AG1]MCH7329695.1 hypothetical protein [Acinetobacter modestus]